ncbi:MAG: hypothetical protein D3904_16430 [Candidatus Electrothrix sp. EH2]|nr:hypothetical protein [Candidatus Electrothrix sp. EH2]
MFGFSTADIENIIRIVGVDEDQAAVLKLQAADIPVPEGGALEEAERLFNAPVQSKEVGDDPPENEEKDEGGIEEAMPGNTVESEEINGNVLIESDQEQEMPPSPQERIDGNRLS